MSTPPFRLSLPAERTTSVVFASPHSGRDYPLGFLRQTMLDEHSIRSSEDAFVDRLYDVVPSLGAPLLAAQAPRAYVDLNRNADELDAALVKGVRSNVHNPRVSSGLGVVPRVVANGREIYRGKLAMADVQSRLDTVWHPYHDTLRKLLAENVVLFGESILIDCHSMPHEAVQTGQARPGPKPQVVLGDRFGAAAAPWIMDHLEAAFTKAGLRVARNTPFAGAYIVQQYGRPSKGQHAVQVEIDRSLYMDEREVRPSQRFSDFREVMRGVAADIVDIGRPAVQLAAE